MLQDAGDHITQAMERADRAPAGTAAAWYALWTHSHCERLVRDQLADKLLHVFFPVLRPAAPSARGRARAAAPMFPGYVFVRAVMDKRTHVEILNTRGVARILGERWDRLSVIPDDEIYAVEQAIQAHDAVQPHPYLESGARVRVVTGPLSGVEGVIVHTKSDERLLVISVHLLRRSVAVTVGRADVERL